MSLDSRRLLLIPTAVGLLISSIGCANLIQTASKTETLGEATSIGGKLHGGQQPIAFATVQLYAIGTTGYGSQATLFATTTTANDGSGSFAFNKQSNTDTSYPASGSTWACPVTGDPYMYLIAHGGNTLGDGNASINNTAAAFLLGIGKCSSISPSSFYFMNEVTSVATLAALTQYFNPVTESVGSPSTVQALQGISNAFATISLLADASQGTAQGTISHTYFRSVSETSKINTFANILSSCINSVSSSSSNCIALFLNAVPPSPSVTSQPNIIFPAATEVIQAGYYMLSNPADGSTAALAALYALSPGAPPFQPALNSVPTDWTIGVSFYSGSTQYCQNATIVYPTQVEVDAMGSVLIVSSEYVAGQNLGGLYYSGYTRMDGTGNALDCATFSRQQAQQVVIDTRGHTWTALKAGETFELGPGIFHIWGVNATSIAADGSGNVFIGSGNCLYALLASTINSASNTISNDPSTSEVTCNLPGAATSMVADPAGNVWVGVPLAGVYELPRSSNYTPILVPGTDTFITPYMAPPMSALSVASDGSVIYPYLDVNGVNQLVHISGATGNYLVTSVVAPARANGVSVDGAGNLWFANKTTTTINGIDYGSVAESNSAGVNLLSSNGITKLAASNAVPGSFVTGLGPSWNIAIDLSGNVWTSNINSNPNLGSGSVFTPSSISEIVGAAVPVVAPYSSALANGTLNSKP